MDREIERNYHVRRFVDNKHMLVFVHYVHRYILRLRPQRLQLRDRAINRISSSDIMRDLKKKEETAQSTAFNRRNALGTKKKKNCPRSVPSFTLSTTRPLTETKPDRMLDWTRALLTPRIREEIQESSLSLPDLAASTVSCSLTPA